MSHDAQQNYVRLIKNNIPHYFNRTRVLEVGSLDINGSVRDFFSDCEYTGIDVGDGRGVDVVCRGEDFGAPCNHYDVIISCEMMEHNRYWQKTWLNMIRMLKGDGLMIMSCATLGRRQHGTSVFSPEDSPLTSSSGDDYYKNLTAGDFAALLNHDIWFSAWSFFHFHAVRDLYFIGVGKDASEDTRRLTEGLIVGIKDYLQIADVNGAF